MFRAYIDESAESGNAVFAVGGFAGREEEWTALEPLWLDALPECIDYFHATDCFGRRGQFANIGMPDRIALLDRLTDLVLDRNIRLVAGVMDVPAYEAISPKLLENEFLGNKYAGTFGAPLEYACQLMNKPGEPMPHEIDDLCAFFIEENEYTPSAFRMLDNIRNDEILWWRKRIGSMTPGTKSGPRAIPLLQVGDLGAFLAAKKLAQAPDGKIPWTKYYEKLEKGKRIFHITHIDDRSIKLMKGLDETLRREREEGLDYWDEV